MIDGAEIGRRIGVARREAGLSQEALAKKVGLAHRQSLQQIETGKRKVLAAELLRFMDVLKKDLEFFTDPFRLIGEGRFTFRVKGGPR